MRPAAGAREFLAEPAGTFLGGRNWLYFCSDPGLFGQIYWGIPDAADTAQLRSLWEAELLPYTPRHASFVDASGLDGMDCDWFQVMNSEMQKNGARLAEKMERQALVRPAGVIGALVAGFYQVLPPSYPVKVFSDAAAALSWLGREDCLPEILELGERALAQDPLVRGLRQHLAGALNDATLASAARALGVSLRTLQRRLREAGTSFQHEVQEARVRAAERLLANDGYKLTAIAREVGCASLQHFSRLFRRIHGVSPAEWRAARR